MNETLKIIDNRRSLRGYDSREISPEHKKWILHSAFRAPTAGNMMHYSIIEVADQKMKDKLVKTCDNQPFIAKAPLVLLFLADIQRWYDFFEYSGVSDLCKERDIEYITPKEGDLMLASCDALIAAQNAVIAAESLGIGSCYIGDIMENIEIHREMFDLPKWVFPITLLCFGYPLRDDRDEREKTRRLPEHLVYFKNKYKRGNMKEFEAEYLERYKDEKDLFKDVSNFGQRVYTRKTGSAFAAEMRRSVKVAISDWVE
ncbi:MAG: nitroreductase family protein [Candidatus Thorarchaeota archaeon]|nr:nitroreductase family protein [Candidatus Thorarchaeota archaeon]